MKQAVTLERPYYKALRPLANSEQEIQSKNLQGTEYCLQSVSDLPQLSLQMRMQIIGGYLDAYILSEVMQQRIQ